ncbi:alkaline phosphatase family protein [Halorubrum ezzemoulense]|uniref:Alkaline phosphatase family protein n=1 Tax=Halorubrum ezzemoulense TaxID=337243 RepID=A0A256JJI6_HALEZ|nr:alkaline phosphatase family protein [Halorubrum ezzemoulense]MDB9248560.1 alkaline phosphatase family protein [Halorubrum ezzemoulense]MDB9251478.1 alkaline phosphatase family protein [Halorubrum ezzemoulense]MDB9255887.1 alkaline phosphatase family protein [Halorubrum ezzemoulense]MDB9259102.1 alkaline phosphatase family protein [Halorubrum ezzemoulense]MDB9262319.1 alkaline phosphatase family protein [Halorubrum ezzemoulense]
MFRDDIERVLRDRQQRDGYLFPAYEDYCFGNVPDTVRSVLDAGGRRALPSDVFDGVETDVDTVVLLLVDGFGLDGWKRHRPRCDLLDRLTEAGTVTPLTSVYPSETAAAITTLETGRLPCEHGCVGWNVYDPRLDTAFLPLGGDVKSGAAAERVPEGSVVGCESLYARMRDAGVDCHRLQPFDAGGEDVTQHVYDGLGSFGERLSAAVAASGDPGYVYAYVPHVDHVSHAEGTDGRAYGETVATVCEQVTAALRRVDRRTAERTLLLVTADHGHVNTDPDANLDLSANEAVTGNLRRHADGTPVKMSGSPRNVHLHLRPGTVPDARRALSDHDARTFTRREAIDRDLFGDRPVSDRFRRRCGDLIVTHRDSGVWFGDVEPEKLSYVGMHGGLNPAEMLVPFAAARASALD